MSPEKIAIAVAVTIAAIAGIGGMKNVIGTSSAVAIVAVRPGTAPTNRPNSDAAEHHERWSTARRPCVKASSERVHAALRTRTACSTPQGSGTRSSL